MNIFDFSSVLSVSFFVGLFFFSYAILLLSKRKKVIVYEGYVGASYKNGALKDILSPGAYFCRDNFFLAEHIAVIDMRETFLLVNSQVIPTRDRALVSVNTRVVYKIADARKNILTSSSAVSSLYQLTQEELRKAVSHHTLDELLEKRDSIDVAMTTAIAASAQEYGFSITSVILKDISVPQTIKEADERIIAAEREARALLVEARAKVAAQRALANAAAIVHANPVILKMQEMDALTHAARTSGNTVVLHFGGEKYEAREVSLEPAHSAEKKK